MLGIQLIEVLIVVFDGLSEIFEKVFGFFKYLLVCILKYVVILVVNDCMFQSGWFFIVSVCNIY